MCVCLQCTPALPTLPYIEFHPHKEMAEEALVHRYKFQVKVRQSSMALSKSLGVRMDY